MRNFLFSLNLALAAFATQACAAAQQEPRPVSSLLTQTWTADNGNGTFTNPLF